MVLVGAGPLLSLRYVQEISVRDKVYEIRAR